MPDRRMPDRRILRPSHRLLFATISLALGLGVPAALVGLTPEAASAQTEEELQAKRDHWQERYRSLLQDRLRYADNLRKSEHNYAQAQRRNYPRGGARDRFRIDAEEARKGLAQTEEAIESLFVEARRASVPPGWLYEVDDEEIRYEMPAAPGADEESEEDRAGRNPLYFDDDEEEQDR